VLSAEHGIQPSRFYTWRKQRCENGTRAFEGGPADRTEGKLQKRIERLEQRPARKHEVRLPTGNCPGMDCNRDWGGGCRAPASARSALSTSPSCSSNLLLSFSQPVKSAARRSDRCCFFQSWQRGVLTQLAANASQPNITF